MVSKYWQAKRRKAGRNFLKNGAMTALNPGPMSIAKLAWSGVKGLRALINAEKHFYDATATGTVAFATGNVLDYTAFAQGDTISTRTGNSVLVNNVQGRVSMVKHASASQTLCRTFLVMDTQQIADTAVAIADILLSVDPLAPLNRNNLGRFKVLWSKKYILTANRPMINFQVYKRFKKHHFRYNGTAAGDIQKGGLYLCTVHTESTNLPTITANYSTVFYDN